MLPRKIFYASRPVKKQTLAIYQEKESWYVHYAINVVTNIEQYALSAGLEKVLVRRQPNFALFYHFIYKNNTISMQI